MKFVWDNNFLLPLRDGGICRIVEGKEKVGCGGAQDGFEKWQIVLIELEGRAQLVSECGSGSGKMVEILNLTETRIWGDI